MFTLVQRTAPYLKPKKSCATRWPAEWRAICLHVSISGSMAATTYRSGAVRRLVRGKFLCVVSSKTQHHPFKTVFKKLFVSVEVVEMQVDAVDSAFTHGPKRPKLRSPLHSKHGYAASFATSRI